MYQIHTMAVLTMLIILEYLVLFTFASVDTYYITSTPNITCPNENTSCVTLTQYAQQSFESVNSSNVTLTFAPEIHHLESNLYVKNVQKLVLRVAQRANNSSLPAAMVVGNDTGFIFENISEIFVRGLEFNGCVENTVRSVDYFRLERCRFYSRHGIELLNVANSTIDSSYFASLKGREVLIDVIDTFVFATEVYHAHFLIPARAGGAILIRDSTVVMNECHFDGNTAEYGGSIYSKDSAVEIIASVFANNTADTDGGAIILNSGTVTIKDCVFINNGAENHGGVIKSIWVGTVTMKHSIFDNNTAKVGGVLNALYGNITIEDSAFTGNTAANTGGIAEADFNTVLDIKNSLFVNSSAKNGGGVINKSYYYRTDRLITIHNSTFVSNTDNFEIDSVIKVELAGIVVIQNSTFINNFTDYSALFLNTFLLIHYVDTKTFYIVPNSSHDCPHENLTCLTLSRYISQSWTWVVSKNITLIFVPGNHLLNSDIPLQVKNVGKLVLQADSKEQETKTLSVAMVMCNNISGFIFENTSEIRISGLEFNGCRDNTIKKVDHLRIEDCRFHTGHGIHLETVANATIERSIFTLLTEREANVKYIHSLFWTISTAARDRAVREARRISNEYPAIVRAGAIVTKKSRVIINRCFFDGNTARLGSSIYSEESDFEISMSNFTRNEAEIGGVMFVHGGTITIHDSTFISNTVADAGGAFFFSEAIVTILRNRFVKNMAADSGGVMVTTSGKFAIHNNTFSNNTAAKDGGAIWTESNIDIQDNKFIHNTANRGSALYIVSSSVSSNGFLLITKNKALASGVVFAFDSLLSFSGKTIISNNYGSLYAFSSNVTFDGYTSITNNIIYVTAIEHGGALTCFQGVVSLKKVDISNNQVYNGSGGAILLTESKIYTYGDTTIANNTALSGGGIYAYQSELNFQGTANILSENTAIENGGGIHAVGTSIQHTGGQLQFSKNKAEKGGGMYLELNSKLYIIKDKYECHDFYPVTQCLRTLNTATIWLRLQFINNSADYGGALYISDDTNAGTCAAESNSDRTTSSECFFQVLELHSFHSDVLNVINTYFANNYAIKSGKTIFGGLIDRCTVSPFAEIFNKDHDLSSSSLNATSYIAKVTDIAARDIQSEISSEPVRICVCKNNEPDCNYSQSLLYQVKKGQTFQVSLVAVDQVNNPLPSVVRAFLSSHDGGLGEGQDIQDTTSNCTELMYTVSSPHDSEQLVLYADGPCNDIGISQFQIDIEFLPCNCPIGFIINMREVSNCVCECDPTLFPKHIINCSFESQAIQRRDYKWINYINSSNHQGYVIHSHCPFDYCRPSSEQVWIKLNVPNGADAQCAFNRSGKLCGSCDDGLSLSLGFSSCMPCSNNWLALIAVFTVAGIALVAFLLICNLTVAVGTINGLIFYANILITTRATFFPFETRNFLTVFIAWLNLDLGIVTCFYDGMDGYAKTWLQLAFPLYIIFMVAVVIIACEYSTTIAKIFTKTHPVATLATLILLSYTISLRVIIAALSSTTLEYPDGSRELVWLTDANIHYLEGKHIPLFLVAILILLVGIVYTLFLFFYQWLLPYSYTRALEWIRSARFYPFMDAYHAPYSLKHRYWTGLLLIVRAFLYVAVALNVSGNPSINLLLITCTLLALCLLKMVLPGRVYKSWLLDVMENSFIFNLLVFSVATLYVRETGGNQAALAYTSTSIAFITFLVPIIFYHTYAFVLPKQVRKKLDLIKNKAPNVEDDDNTYNVIKPVQENKCTHSVIDGIPNQYKIGEEIIKPIKNNSVYPSQVCNEEVTGDATMLTNDQNSECHVDIELKEIPADQNSSVTKMKQNSIASCEDCEKSYIDDIEKRGTERETEINDFIEITQ